MFAHIFSLFFFVVSWLVGLGWVDTNLGFFCFFTTTESTNLRGISYLNGTSPTSIQSPSLSSYVSTNSDEPSKSLKDLVACSFSPPISHNIKKWNINNHFITKTSLTYNRVCHLAAPISINNDI